MMGDNTLTKVAIVNPPSPPLPPEKKEALGQFVKRLCSLVFFNPL